MGALWSGPRRQTERLISRAPGVSGSARPASGPAAGEPFVPSPAPSSERNCQAFAILLAQGGQIRGRASRPLGRRAANQLGTLNDPSDASQARLGHNAFQLTRGAARIRSMARCATHVTDRASEGRWATRRDAPRDSGRLPRFEPLCYPTGSAEGPGFFMPGPVGMEPQQRGEPSVETCESIK